MYYSEGKIHKASLFSDALLQFQTKRFDQCILKTYTCMDYYNTLELRRRIFRLN